MTEVLKIGFTGTQHGMTRQQKDKVLTLLSNMKDSEFHHGDCIGSDAQAADMARLCGHRLVCHPPILKDKRAHVPSDEYRKRLGYLERDKVIANECDLLIATPFEMKEKIRSGTWATIRYARHARKRIFIVLSTGYLVEENW